MTRDFWFRGVVDTVHKILSHTRSKQSRWSSDQILDMTNYAIDVLRPERAVKDVDSSGVEAGRGNGTIQNRLIISRSFSGEQCER